MLREPFFKQTPDPCCQSLGIGAAPWLLLGRSACSVRQTGNVAVFMWPRLLSHINSLRTLWNLNCTCISFPSNNDQHYFSEQTVKGAFWKDQEGWDGLGKQRSLGMTMPSRSSWWDPLVSSWELSLARAGLCIERTGAAMPLKPQWQQTRRRPDGLLNPWPCQCAPRFRNKSCGRLSRSQWEALPCQPGPCADLTNSAAALSPKWEHWFCVQDLFQVVDEVTDPQEQMPSA